LELGGKSPILVFEDAHIESAVDWLKSFFFFFFGMEKKNSLQHIAF
jgi:acyl-CoA reductase-like NAD-dependent aldehyde dehydrogenase